MLLDDAMNRVWVNLEKRRYYRVIIQRDLLSDWTITRSWGSLDNKRGQLRSELINSDQNNMKLIEQIDKRREYRGYKRVI
jgi:hypothetical protein